ncbi:hypothetical protein BKA62DRAFT_346644 [Auriculariales sp. MPI-PUGE-AT-0066]|nr:hypothetical protein BKA62DRAFT_346644 [Auriculariales sp. MPI-PUGE-AT-0066]
MTIGIRIIQCAAEQFSADDRRTVINLALSSRLYYKLVAPILYRTMVITESNIDAVRSFMEQPQSKELAKRVCSLVRTLVITFSFEYSDEEFRSFQWLTSVQHLAAPYNTLPAVIAAAKGDCKISSINLWYVDYAKGVRGLPDQVKHRLSHISGFVTKTTRYADDPAWWCESTIGQLPALTHIGFELMQVATVTGVENTSANFDLDAFERLLRAVLTYDRLVCIAIRLAGDYYKRATDFQQLGQRFQDVRLKFWLDPRPLDTWSDDDEVAIADAWHDHTIWTESLPLELSLPTELRLA